MAVNVVLKGVVTSVPFSVPMHKSMSPVVAHKCLASTVVDQISRELVGNLDACL